MYMYVCMCLYMWLNLGKADVLVSALENPNFIESRFFKTLNQSEVQTPKHCSKFSWLNLAYKASPDQQLKA